MLFKFRQPSYKYTCAFIANEVSSWNPETNCALIYMSNSYLSICNLIDLYTHDIFVEVKYPRIIITRSLS